MKSKFIEVSVLERFLEKYAEELKNSETSNFESETLTINLIKKAINDFAFEENENEQ